MTISEKLRSCTAHKYDCDGCSECDKLHRVDCMEKLMRDAANQLAAYEDTRHTPEECAAAFEELSAYRAAEQDGTLHWLPCPVGTMVWSYDLCNCLYQGERCHYDCNSSQRKTVFNKNCLKYCEVYQFEFTINHLNDFGKTVFLTQEEAEAALKEQEGNDGK